MSWQDILKSIEQLKNEIDTWEVSQKTRSGPLTIYFSSMGKKGPHPKLSNVYFVDNQQDLDKLKEMYRAEGDTIIDRPPNAFMIKE